MMKHVMGLGLAMAVSFGAAQAADINGAGASFPAPIYFKWAEDFKKSTGNGVNYQSIGSGGGVKQIKAKTVDFGASDEPMKPEELSASGLMQFPMVMGGVVPIVNLPGVLPGQMKLDGNVLAKIFMGEIKRWDDPAIKALNPTLRLTPLPITVVHRSDGSGTTFLFTSYLSMENGTWKSKVGGNKAVSWPTGLGGKGNEGVTAFVKQTLGSIGYVEYAYAKKVNLAHTQLQNKSGAFVNPSADTFKAAAAGADWSKAPGMYMLLLDQPGAKSWPIAGATFILMHKDQANAASAKGALTFFDWAYKNGDATANAMQYVPMPDAVKALVRKSWSQIQASGKPVFAAK